MFITCKYEQIGVHMYILQLKHIYSTITTTVKHLNANKVARATYTGLDDDPTIG